MAALVHVFVCSRIEYYNSLHIGSTKDPTLPPPSEFSTMLKHVLLAFLNSLKISSVMVKQFLWLLLSARIQFKMYVLNLKSKLGVAPDISGIIFEPPILQLLVYLSVFV